MHNSVQEHFRSVNNRIGELEPLLPVDYRDVVCECRNLTCTTMLR